MDLHHRVLAAMLPEVRTDAIVATDRDGYIRVWSPDAVRIFGYSADEAIGQTLDIFIPEHLRTRHWTGFAGAVALGRIRYEDDAVLSAPAMTKDGRRISVEFTALMVTDAQGTVLGLSAVIRDVFRQFAELKMLRQRLADLESKWVDDGRA